MAVGWSPNTLETYGAGLLVFHIVCDERAVPEEERAPASADLLNVFISTLAGSYSVSTLNNYLAGVRAWHLLHRLPWLVDNAHQAVMLRGAATLARHHDATCNPTDRIGRDKRLPMTIAVLTRARGRLDTDTPLDAAVLACATTMLHAMARPGELTVPALAAFTAEEHVTIAHLRRDVVDRHGNKVSILRIPRTKSAPAGEDVFWAAQTDDTDPEWALDNHLRVNQPQADEHLFTYAAREKGGRRVRRPLTYQVFTRRLSKAIAAAGVTEKYSAHSFRIGGTMEYLLRGIPFAVVRVKGRWASDAFHVYLRQHAEVMAPYMQANPEVWRAMVHHIRVDLPTVR